TGRVCDSTAPSVGLRRMISSTTRCQPVVTSPLGGARGAVGALAPPPAASAARGAAAIGRLADGGAAVAGGGPLAAPDGGTRRGSGAGRAAGSAPSRVS